MISPAVKEWLQLLVPPTTVGDVLDNPRRAFFTLLLSCVVGCLWRACFVLLSCLIKARLCNSSSSTPMARDQAGIRKWTSKIAPACRYGLLCVLENEVLGWLGWFWLVMGLQGGSWWGIQVNLLRVPRDAAVTLVVGCVWETLWLWLLEKPYDKLNEAQTECYVKIHHKEVKSWSLKIKFWMLKTVRLFIRNWVGGLWAVLITLAYMDAESVEEIPWKLRIPWLMILYNLLVHFLPILSKIILYNLLVHFLPILSKIIKTLKGHRRQAARRHGSHKSTVMELSGGKKDL